MVHRVLSVTAAVALAVFSVLPASAQITTGNVLGTIKDAQGAVVPGATVVLVSETKGTKSAPVVTNGAGDYVFPNVTADTYTVEVSMEGFKTVRRTGVSVSGGDRVAVGSLVLDVGGDSGNGQRHGRISPRPGVKRRALVRDYHVVG
jgi:hypothetical protein